MSSTPPPPSGGQPDYGQHGHHQPDYGHQGHTNPYGQGDYGTAPVGAGEPPASVNKAIMLIWANVALGVLSFILTIVMLDTIVDKAVQDAGLDASTADGAAKTGAIIGGVFGLLLSVGIALLVVIFLKKGANWARILYTVIGGLGILFSLIGIAGQPAILLVLNLIGIVITAAAIFFLWQKDSTAFFTRRTA